MIALSIPRYLKRTRQRSQKVIFDETGWSQGILQVLLLRRAVNAVLTQVQVVARLGSWLRTWGLVVDRSSLTTALSVKRLHTEWRTFLRSGLFFLLVSCHIWTFHSVKILSISRNDLCRSGLGIITRMGARCSSGLRLF